MEEKVSLLEKTIINSINELFSTLPFGAYSTDSEFNDETGELTVIGEYHQQIFECGPDNIVENPSFKIMSLIRKLNEYLKDNKLVIQDPKYNIEVKHNLVNAIIIEIRYTVRQ